MKTQTIEDMMRAGASRYEAEDATKLFDLLRPGLKVKRNGRVELVGGDKTPLGLYRTIKKTMEG
jgi:hypothetical protein